MTLNRNSKYGNKRTKVDGRTFHSKVEAQRYLELKEREKQGAIFDLVCQPRFPLEVNGILVTTYIADFSYRRMAGHKILDMTTPVIEDVKGGAVTPEFSIKRRLMKACNNIDIKIVRKRSRSKTNRWFVDDTMEEKMYLPLIRNDI